MTVEIFRDDAYAKSCEATITAHVAGGVILDQTVFYPHGGGQPGDIGTLRAASGTDIPIINTLKGKEDAAGEIVHVVAEGATLPAVGESVTLTLNWDKRYDHMRMHTCLHLLCSLIEGGVTGGSIGALKSRLDFDLENTDLDKEQITEDLNKLIDADHPLTISWITDEEMMSRPELVRTMSVKPPMGQGKVRIMDIGDGIDLQPCGGTHVKSTAEIGRVRIGKIENKGKHNRRVNVVFNND